MRSAALFLLFLASTSLPGCLDDLLDPEDAGVTALDAWRVADARAQAWSPGAMLLVAEAVESRDESMEGQADAEHFGDGRAQRYTFLFRGPGTDDAWNVTVGGDGRVVDEGPVDAERAEGREPVTGWRVDSTELVEVLRREADGFAQRSEAGMVEDLFYLLGTDAFGWEDGGVAWAVLELVGGGDLHLHVVSASNGTLLRSGPFAFNFDIFLHGAESGSFEGTLTATDPAAEHDVTLEVEHEAVGFRLAADTAFPGDVLTLNVTGPDGTHHEATLEPLVPGDDVGLRVDPAPQGTWTARVELDGVAVAYTLEYCTTGLRIDVSPLGSPCDRVNA